MSSDNQEKIDNIVSVFVDYPKDMAIRAINIALMMNMVKRTLSSRIKESSRFSLPGRLAQRILNEKTPLPEIGLLSWVGNESDDSIIRKECVSAHVSRWFDYAFIKTEAEFLYRDTTNYSCHYYIGNNSIMSKVYPSVIAGLYLTRLGTKTVYQDGFQRISESDNEIYDGNVNWLFMHLMGISRACMSESKIGTITTSKDNLDDVSMLIGYTSYKKVKDQCDSMLSRTMTNVEALGVVSAKFSDMAGAENMPLMSFLRRTFPGKSILEVACMIPEAIVT